MKVDRQGIIRLKGLPYPPGTEVDVIVFPEPGQEGIYDYTAQLISRKKIPRYSMKKIEEIVHEVRGVDSCSYSVTGNILAMFSNICHFFYNPLLNEKLGYYTYKRFYTRAYRKPITLIESHAICFSAT